MNRTIARLIATPLLSVIVLFSLELNAQTKETATPKLASLIITTDSNSTSPLSCLQLLPDETITVYAVGLDEKGKLFAISKDSVVHWSGGDALEVKSTGPHSATVKLVKPLKFNAVVTNLSNHLTYDGKSYGSSVEIAQKIKELPKVWIVSFFRDPEATKPVRDEEPVGANEHLIIYTRGSATFLDSPTGELLFMIPVEASVSWKSVPKPPMGSEFKFTPIGCSAVKIELVKKGNPDYGFDKSGTIMIEVDNLPDGKKREMALGVKIK